MVADTASGRYQDQPGHGAEASPGGPGSRPGDAHSVRSRLAENRDRAAYAEALRAAAGPRRDGHPVPDSIRLPPERARHILDGDSWGGGHRPGTGRPGKAEFPADWDDERTIGHILDVARHPDTRPVWQPNHRWRLYGERDAVGVTVIVKRDGGIWAACGRKTSMACGRWPEPVNGALVDLLVASLGSSGAPVSAEERGELRSLLAAMDMPDAPLAGLTVAGYQPGEPLGPVPGQVSGVDDRLQGAVRLAGEAEIGGGAARDVLPPDDHRPELSSTSGSRRRTHPGEWGTPPG